MTFSRCTILYPWLAAAVFSMSAQAATYTWDGGGADDSFGTAENWTPDGFPFVAGAPAVPAVNGHKIVIGPLVSGGQTSINMNVGGNPDGFEFTSGASAMTIYGTNNMQIAGANLTPIINNSDQTQTFSNTVRQFWIGGATTGTHPNLIKNRTWDAAAGDISYQGILLRPDGININSTTAIVSTAILTFTGSFNQTVNSTINLEGTWTGKTANLVKNGSGTLFLKGGGNFNGATTINTGIVRIYHNSSLGTGSVTEAQKTDIKSGAALEIDGSLSLTEFIRVTGTGISGNGAIRAISGTTSHSTQIAMEGTGGVVVSFGVDSGATLKVAKLYSDPGRDTNFAKVGAGKLILTSNESDNYVGTTTISAGTMQVGDGGTTGELKSSAAVSNNAALVFNRSNAYDFTGAISGSGTLEQAGSDTLTLSGTSTYTGATTVSSGTLLVTGQLGNTATTVKDGASIGGDGTIAGSLHLDAGANLIFDATQPLTVNGSTVTFGGFGVTDLVGFDENVALGTYTLINGTASISTTNLLHFGIENAYNIGAGKQAYFSTGSLQLVVVPEASTLLLGLFGSLALLRRQRSYSI